MTVSKPSPAQSDQDRRFMQAAVALARRGLGRVWPNPSVGALIVAQDQNGFPILAGRGVTSRPGSAHAEVNALRQAGERARGAACYVTLEPCSHHGRTPPCADALIAAGVARVVIGCLDPNPRVSGRGAARLKEAGLEVVTGVEEAACRDLQIGFIRRIMEQRPAVSLKMAMSRDGFIGRKGDGQVRISGPEAGDFVHGMRSNHDAILVGIGTALADDPELTCRLPGLADRSPVRVVLDTDARLPLTSKLVSTAADVPTWVICGNDADRDRLSALAEAGVLVIKVPAPGGRIEPEVALKALGMRGITRLMVEGGASVAASFWQSGVVDVFMLVTGNVLVGEGGIPPFAGLSLDEVHANPNYEPCQTGWLGCDQIEILRRRGT
ncbi:bifunctional diaminohydroxyphosphoribosylaminopyrimidine deaminase/5-amino-6-(5-phosphoribosylamino)uracil reductase RibD [Labrenzia suaedae]|uniref:Riboflavin biosynthesis protein RibD n=2 Tax=Roseibium litorale TaxID=2803841 RepID=A0ABR9CW35_9HYPH|nr:bifunctional diaminohydroxyphosphoribosylaminopyrimidine deaminase/5-amino-6-(5-phosphoribosylamino)uracil reductase RibD [Roseibium litorale]MBD8894282.1 bifunctional diaminohydroxyphosphoribosylaminopyrimidine deaminase/5-amino-6-(5-phosphoribosylamino)uracil reductase RibD [Roseibium litorale]